MIFYTTQVSDVLQEADRPFKDWGRGCVKEESKQYIKLLAMVSSMGISMGLAIVIGILIGYYLDKWLKTSPYFFLIFMIFGIVAGFRNIFIIMKRVEKDMK